MYAKTLAIAGLALSLFVVPAAGHHSFSMFDQDQFVNLTGTVSDFEWINPHAWLHVSVINEAGTAQTWSFEGGNLRGLSSAGWRPDSVAAGDEVAIGFNPMIDGSRGGQLRTLILPDGTKLCNGARFCEPGAEEATY